MTFKLNINLHRAKILSSTRIYLELLLTENDYDELLNVFKRNYTDNYLRFLYSMPSDRICYEISERCTNEHVVDNLSYDDNENEFEKLYYVIKLKNNQIIGGFDIYMCDNDLEIGLFIDKEHAGKGYGTEAVNLIIKLFENYSQIERIKWTCDVKNIASEKIAKKCNFIYTELKYISPGVTDKIFYLNFVR